MNAPAKNTGLVEIHGRIYETVALRVQKFREKCPTHTLLTKIMRLDEDEVLIEAQILDETGRLIANGHAQEFRQASAINKTSYVENCETSALGRALAAFGLGGSEFATADELANAIVNKKPPSGSAAGFNKECFDAMSEDEQKFLREIEANLVALLDENRTEEAYSYVEAQKLDDQEKPALWSLLNSKQRSAIKAAGAAIRDREAKAQAAAEHAPAVERKVA